MKRLIGPVFRRKDPIRAVFPGDIGVWGTLQQGRRSTVQSIRLSPNVCPAPAPNILTLPLTSHLIPSYPTYPVQPSVPHSERQGRMRKMTSESMFQCKHFSQSLFPLLHSSFFDLCCGRRVKSVLLNLFHIYTTYLYICASSHV